MSLEITAAVGCLKVKNGKQTMTFPLNNINFDYKDPWFNIYNADKSVGKFKAGNVDVPENDGTYGDVYTKLDALL